MRHRLLHGPNTLDPAVYSVPIRDGDFQLEAAPHTFSVPPVHQLSSLTAERDKKKGTLNQTFEIISLQEKEN